MSTTNPDSTLTSLTAELAQATPPEGVTHVGILAVKTANRTIIDAAARPNPRDLYLSLWYEGEVCCLFADSNIGKSIFAVQMAEEIARTAKVLYLDCELSDKQFQLRYCDKNSGARHIFPENLLRAEIRPEAIYPKTYEESIIRDIETAALSFGASIIIVDNLTYLCNSSEKGDVAGLFMMKLLDLKKRHNMSILIIAHTPKRNMANPITQNDLAVSTPQGIIVFEVKDYSGWIFGNGNSKYWMQILSFGEEKHQFYNPIWQNRSHITALRKLPPNNPDIPIFNIVVFYGNSEFKDLDYDTSGRVRVIYNTQVVELIKHIKNLPLAEYGNKREVANVFAEGVRNGRDPVIRQTQLDFAARAKANSRESHTYSSRGFRLSKRLTRHIFR